MFTQHTPQQRLDSLYRSDCATIGTSQSKAASTCPSSNSSSSSCSSCNKQPLRKSKLALALSSLLFTSLSLVMVAPAQAATSDTGLVREEIMHLDVSSAYSDVVEASDDTPTVDKNEQMTAEAAAAEDAAAQQAQDAISVEAAIAAQAETNANAHADADADATAAVDVDSEAEAEAETDIELASSEVDEEAEDESEDEAEPEDPLATKKPSLWQRLMGTSMSDANASPVGEFGDFEHSFLLPQLLTDFEPLKEQTANGGYDLIATVPFKIDESMLIDIGDTQQDIVDQLQLGLSMVSYLFHMYKPQSGNFTVPLYFVNADDLDHVSSEYNITQGTTLIALGHVQNGDTQETDTTAPAPTEKTKQTAPKAHSKEQHAEHVRTQLNHLGLALDHIYGVDQDCAGMSLIEAELKNKCHTSETFNGLLLLTMPIPEVAKEGIYTGMQQQVTPNVLKSNYFAQGIDLGVRLVGVNSAYEPRNATFVAPLHSFDKHLYSPNLHNFVQTDTKLTDLGDKCSQQNQSGECQLYFIGRNVNKLLAPSNQQSEFYLNAKESLDVGTPDADISSDASNLKAHASAAATQEQANTQAAKEQAVPEPQATEQATTSTETATAQVEESRIDHADTQTTTTKSASERALEAVRKYDLYGIPVSFSALGKPLLGLRNTIMSSDQYKNYAFLTEVEMAMLADLGYRLEPREFFGTSIYSFGSEKQRITRAVRNDFAFYDHGNEQYDTKKPAVIPLAVGVHLYGSYNNVVHSANILSEGQGNIGVRVDGSANYYYQTPASNIVTNGDDSVGLAFTYGRDNKAYISGKISALGKQGMGIKVDMGSNIYSDLIEYRGSYVRVRTLDYLQGVASEDEAITVPLLDDINGPQISELIIDGNVEGSEAAIYIDESSFVRSINVTANAVLNGGIYSTWNPRSTGSGEIMLTHDRKRTILDGVVQYPRDSNDGLTAGEFIDRYLTTDINLGVTLDQNNQLLYRDEERKYLQGNNASRVVLQGDISSNTFNIHNYGGKATILGNVRANKIDVHRGILSLCSPQDYATNQINTLRVRSNSILDFVNGKSSHTYVQGDINFGSNVVVRVDVDENGNLLDEVTHNGRFNAHDYQLTIEPAVTYSEMRRLGADPKAMLTFITNFVQNCNQRFANDGITLRMPHYIWDSAGNYGREIRCNARGCRIGAFASNSTVKTDLTNVEPWRYTVSAVGIVIMILGFYLWYYGKPLYRRLRAKKQQQS